MAHYIDIDILQNDINNMVEDFMSDTMLIEPEAVGLDRRVGTIFVTPDKSCIIAPLHNQACIEYYGGFEYVDREAKKVIGNYVFYLATDDRVEDHLSLLED